MIVDTDHQRLKPFEEKFKTIPNVTCLHTDIRELNADMIVSPANSLGLMDGGLDHVICEILGRIDLEKIRPIIQKNG